MKKMDTFKVGFSRVNIDPPLGIGVHGYYSRGSRPVLSMT